MTTKDHSVAELKALFRVGNHVDIYKATGLLAAAITEEMKPVEESDLTATWASVLEPEDFESASQHEGLTLFPIPVLFARYVDFMDAVGEELGVELDLENGMCDDWISDSMPKSRAISTALAALCADYLAEASASLRAEKGYTPAEVFVQSVNTGESFEQSKIRIAHSTKGLNAVNQTKGVDGSQT